MPPFLGILAAALVSIPGLLLSFYVVSGWKMESFGQAWVGFKAIAAYFLPFYILGAFVYGVLLWWALRHLGQSRLVGFLVGSLLPVAVCLAVDALLRGYGSGTHVAFIAFGIPSLFMGFALWFFTARGQSAT